VLIVLGAGYGAHRICGSRLTRAGRAVGARAEAEDGSASAATADVATT
jgi:hypothetical protein